MNTGLLIRKYSEGTPTQPINCNDTYFSNVEKIATIAQWASAVTAFLIHRAVGP
jgi:hypothetical protein